MALSSMTGFARSHGGSGPYTFEWELKSVNAKGFDLRLRLPPGWDELEALAKKRAGELLSRGTVYANLSVKRTDAAQTIRINEDVLAAVVKVAGELAQRIDAVAPSIDGLLGIKGVIEVVEPENDEDEDKAAREAAAKAGIWVHLGSLALRRADGSLTAATREEQKALPVRLRLLGEHGVADLTGPAACELLNAEEVAADASAAASSEPAPAAGGLAPRPADVQAGPGGGCEVVEALLQVCVGGHAPQPATASWAARAMASSSLVGVTSTATDDSGAETTVEPLPFSTRRKAASAQIWCPALCRRRKVATAAGRAADRPCVVAKTVAMSSGWMTSRQAPQKGCSTGTPARMK
mgnify:CR=1 FL=1